MFFDIGWTELALIGGVALIAIGPKELPGALRTAGQWVGKARRLAQEFQSQFQEVLREAHEKTPGAIGDYREFVDKALETYDHWRKTLGQVAKVSYGISLRTSADRSE